MKCDELEEYYYYEDTVITPSTHLYRVYHADKVDAAIAELKARIQLDDDEMAGFLDLEEECGGGDLRNYIAELKAKLAEKDKEIAELKKKLMPCLNGDCILTCEVVEKYGKENAELKQKLEDVKASHYAEMVDAGMRERRLKRELWIARAQRANEHYHRYHGKFLGPLEDIPKYVKWKNVERKCRAKAEEYK